VAANLCAIGIDLGGTKLLGALVDQRGRSLACVRRPTPVEAGPTGVFAAMRAAVDELLAAAHGQRVVGIGLGIPGLLDRERGLSLFSEILGWHGLAVLPEFTGYGLPAAMDNDVRCHTLGEFYFGAGRGCTDFALLTLGTGIGSGIILGGRLYRGKSAWQARLDTSPLSRMDRCAPAASEAALRRWPADAA